MERAGCDVRWGVCVGWWVCVILQMGEELGVRVVQSNDTCFASDSKAVQRRDEKVVVVDQKRNCLSV